MPDLPDAVPAERATGGHACRRTEWCERAAAFQKDVIYLLAAQCSQLMTTRRPHPVREAAPRVLTSERPSLHPPAPGHRRRRHASLYT